MPTTSQTPNEDAQNGSSANPAIEAETNCFTPAHAHIAAARPPMPATMNPASPNSILAARPTPFLRPRATTTTASVTAKKRKPLAPAEAGSPSTEGGDTAHSASSAL